MKHKLVNEFRSVERDELKKYQILITIKNASLLKLYFSFFKGLYLVCLDLHLCFIRNVLLKRPSWLSLLPCINPQDSLGGSVNWIIFKGIIAGDYELLGFC